MANLTTKGDLTVLIERRGQSAVDWEIQNFMHRYYVKGEYLQSPHFSLGDATWYLRIHPNGDWREESKGWISLYLCKAYGSNIYTVLYSFEMKAGAAKVEEIVYKNTFNNKKYSWGGPQFVERSTLSDVLEGSSSNGTVTIKCRAILTESRHQDTVVSRALRPQDLGTLVSDLETLFLSERLSDVRLIVGHRKFQAHKSILAARSEVFAAMLEHDMKEKNSGVVEITDCDPDFFRDFLLFLYSGKADVVTAINASDLFKTADKYGVTELKEQSVLCMINSMSSDTVLDMIQLAVTYNRSDLLETATDFFIKNTEDIFITEKWESFMVECTRTAKDLLIKTTKRNKQ